MAKKPVRANDEDKAALVELVKEEITLHKGDNSYRLTQNLEYAELLGVSKASIKRYLGSGLSNEDRDYRTKGIQSYATSKMWQDPEHVKKMSDIMTARWQEQGYREKMSSASKEMWQDPKHVEKISQLSSDPEYRERLSQIKKKLGQDPEHVKKMSRIRTEEWQDPEHRKNHLESKSNPKFREKMSRILLKRWQDPDQRENMLKSKSDPEYIEKLSKAMVERWQDPNQREKMSQESSQRALERLRKFGNIIMPNFNPYACNLIETYGALNGYNFIHALSPSTEVQVTDKVRRNLNNGTGECQVRITDDDGNIVEERWVDGYDPIRNVVIEFYENAHRKQTEKDLRRQKTIQDFLRCEFIILEEGSQEVQNLESMLAA